MVIKTTEFIKSSVNNDQCPQANMPEYAFIGRSNVGKSSLINMLTNRKKLAKISARPGKTQHINHFNINDKWYLVDLPGYGYAKVSKKMRISLQNMIDNYIMNRDNLMNLFVLIDSKIPPQKIDLDFIIKMGTSQIPFAIIFTKSDRLSKTAFAKSFENYKEKLLENWEKLPPIFESSAVNSTGRSEILKYIKETNKFWTK